MMAVGFVIRYPPSRFLLFTAPSAGAAHGSGWLLDGEGYVGPVYCEVIQSGDLSTVVTSIVIIKLLIFFFFCDAFLFGPWGDHSFGITQAKLLDHYLGMP